MTDSSSEIEIFEMTQTSLMGRTNALINVRAPSDAIPGSGSPQGYAAVPDCASMQRNMLAL
ncbi:MAG: hypothetical protein J0H38_14040 [Rhizobiales bacterium]|nr:hypothetical protein [Hyphomicrobiales bacterium]